MSRLCVRVTSAARSASRGFSAVSPPRSATAASISARRVENAETTSRDTPDLEPPVGVAFLDAVAEPR